MNVDRIFPGVRLLASLEQEGQGTPAWDKGKEALWGVGTANIENLLGQRS